MKVLRSTANSSAERGEVNRVAGKRHVNPSLLYISSSAERLRNLTVTGDRTKPVLFGLTRPPISAIASAAATAMATLHASVNIAYINVALKDVARTFLMPLPAYFNSWTARDNSNTRLHVQCLPLSCKSSYGRGCTFWVKPFLAI